MTLYADRAPEQTAFDLDGTHLDDDTRTAVCNLLDGVCIVLDHGTRPAVLTRTEEKALSEAVQAGVKARRLLEQIGLELIEVDEDTVGTLSAAVEFGTQARDRFVASNIGLVETIVARMHGNNGLTFEDLRQAGMQGLIDGIERFNPAQGKFSPFVGRWIQRRVNEEIANDGKPIRIPRQRLAIARAIAEARADGLTSVDEIAARIGERPELVSELVRADAFLVALPVTEDHIAPFGAVSEATPLEQLEEAEAVTAIHDRLAALADIEREVIERKYGFGDHDPQTLDEIAAAVDLSRSRVHQIHRKALSKLKHPCAGHTLRTFLFDTDEDTGELEDAA